MSNSQKVSINQIIGNVIGNLRLKNVNNLMDDFARWACEAENKIGSTSSYRKFECELTIRNRKASLPPNFVYLNALKYGNKIVPVTKRSFTMFNKGSKNNVIENTQENNPAALVIVGVPLSIDVLFTGVYAAGDVVVVTIASSNCGDTTINTFNYIVLVSDTLSTIAQAIANQINAIGNLGYDAVVGANKFNVTGCDPDINFNITLHTDSILGKIKQCVVQKRVAPKNTEISSSGISTDPKLTSNNLANGNVNKLHTGINSQGPNASGYRYDADDSEQVFSIDNGCINFNVYDDERIGISYMGIDLDEDGWPLISELHEDAVTHYLMFMYKSADYWNGKMNRGTWMDLQTRWFDLCGQARGDDELPNSEEMKYLSSMWMQLIPPPNRESF